MELTKELGAEAVQVHGRAGLDELMIIKKTMPELIIIKSLIVRENNTFELESEMNEYSYLADAFLTDTFDPATGATGATGKTHDWRVSKRLAEIAPKPLILSGGLNPANAQAAIYLVNPFGVDVHTGIEDAEGNKDYELSVEFIFNSRQALERN
jgi:phosphoribosylanthranilate isomerase